MEKQKFNNLVKKAASYPAGSPERRKILAHLIRSKAASARVAAGDYLVWAEDENGHMVMFSGPMSQSAAKRWQKSPKVDNIVENGGESTIMPVAQAVSRELKPASKAWFSKLPSADKKKLDAVLTNGKKASAYSGEWDYKRDSKGTAYYDPDGRYRVLLSEKDKKWVIQRAQHGRWDTIGTTRYTDPDKAIKDILKGKVR